MDSSSTALATSTGCCNSSWCWKSEDEDDGAMTKEEEEEEEASGAMGQAAGACWSKSTRKELSPNTSPASKSFSFSSFLSNSFKMSLFVRVLGFGRPSKSISSGGSSTTAAG